ncbi:hypothetical protein HDU92_002979 [Lobulomyces angularis]|nr:hypothetical protein HDU92_002979 [Lobulomyces angularis]
MDKLKVERERGITVKAQTASMIYNYKGEDYLLNLIDTPGHVDFSYEVSRSLSACQGTLLLVDASQGIQAQTMANFYLAFCQDLKIIPVLNKIDLPGANVEKVTSQIRQAFEVDEETEIISISAKTGINVDKILPMIIEQVPSPSFKAEDKFRCLLFDSWYDQYVGVVCLIAVGDGKLSLGDKIASAATGIAYDVSELGFMHPDQTPCKALYAGQVGYVVLNMKTTKEAHIGDTYFHAKEKKENIKLFPEFEMVKSMVFSGLYPVDSSDYSKLSEALDRLTLNDSSVSVVKESSMALGQGFRVGFLGRLHMDVFQQRLVNKNDEYGAAVINTQPTVTYKIRYHTGEEELIQNPADFPEGDDIGKIEAFFEPIVMATLILPAHCIGNMMSLCESHRGEIDSTNFLDETRVMIKYKLPLAEILIDFHNQVKSRSSGYASFDYEEIGYRESDLVKVNFLLNGKVIDALSAIVHRGDSVRNAKNGVLKLKKVMERDLIDIAIQGSINGKIVSRESIKALRKDVTAKCYGGDVTRRMKLLDKQKEGKKRMKSLSHGVKLPQEAFLSLLSNT